MKPLIAPPPAVHYTASPEPGDRGGLTAALARLLIDCRRRRLAPTAAGDQDGDRDGDQDGRAGR